MVQGEPASQGYIISEKLVNLNISIYKIFFRKISKKLKNYMHN